MTVTPIEMYVECIFKMYVQDILWIFFCIFIKGLVTLFYIGHAKTRDVLTQMAHGRL